MKSPIKKYIHEQFTFPPELCKKLTEEELDGSMKDSSILKFTEA